MDSSQQMLKSQDYVEKSKLTLCIHILKSLPATQMQHQPGQFLATELQHKLQSPEKILRERNRSF